MTVPLEYRILGSVVVVTPLVDLVEWVFPPELGGLTGKDEWWCRGMGLGHERRTPRVVAAGDSARVLVSPEYWAEFKAVCRPYSHPPSYLDPYRQRLDCDRSLLPACELGRVLLSLEREDEARRLERLRRDVYSTQISPLADWLAGQPIVHGTS